MKGTRKKESAGPSAITGLRGRAERAMAKKPPVDASASQTDAQRLLHELQVHQIELEMQNEELARLKNETEALLAKYLDVYDFAPVGYFTLDAGGQILQANLTGAAFLGVERSRLYNRRLRGFVAEDFLPAFDAFFTRAFAREDFAPCEIALAGVRPPARSFLLKAALSEDGRECRLAMIDITEKKRGEENLHRYELLASHSRDSILFLDGDDKRIVEANNAAVKAYGYTREELLGMKVFALLAADAPLPTAAQMAEADDAGFLFETRHRRKGGSTFPVEVSVRGATIGGQRILISMIRDITMRKQAEASLTERTKDLESVNRELEGFSYSVSHDLRAPLRAIDGYARMILRKEQERFDQDTLEKFNEIRKGAKAMGQLIDDLLTFSRLGRQASRMAKLEMDSLIRDVWNELRRADPDREGLTLEIGRLPQGMGDPHLLRQVWSNLLSNAIKFTRLRESALIEVGGYPEGEECVYFIRDNGVGFDMAYRDKLFGVFQRLHSAEAYEGTGIGLALVQRVINRHGGRVWAQGEEGKGATFFFTLTAAKG